MLQSAALRRFQSPNAAAPASGTASTPARNGTSRIHCGAPPEKAVSLTAREFSGWLLGSASSVKMTLREADA